jgi:chaperonin cofactor prefoldin
MPLSEKVIQELQNSVASLTARKAQIDLEISELGTYLENHNQNAARQKADYEQQIETKTNQSEGIRIQIESLNATIQG